MLLANILLLNVWTKLLIIWLKVLLFKPEGFVIYWGKDQMQMIKIPLNNMGQPGYDGAHL